MRRLYDVNPVALKKIAGRGVRGASSIDELAARRLGDGSRRRAGQDRQELAATLRTAVD